MAFIGVLIKRNDILIIANLQFVPYDIDSRLTYLGFNIKLLI